MQKLPIGIQTFRNIREDDYIYIDKTQEAYELISNYTYTFLSRPRRFGKSLFLDTLKNIFEGNRELFEGLYIYDKWDWEVKYPVIKISWDGKNRSLSDLESNLKDCLLENQKKLDIACDSTSNLDSCFRRLIQESYSKYKQKVVILIDEYDKPILDVIEDPQQAKEHREYIKGFYSIIKGCDEYIKFAFLTGVSKFSKSSIFSGLNMLTDISLDAQYGNICGYTQSNIENEFKELLGGTDLAKLKAWYNGYNFLKDDVYNPFDILQFIAQGYRFKNYWFETGTPTFLVKLLEKNNYFLPNLSNLIIDEKLLSSFAIEKIDFEVILYQSGYLTIAQEIVEDMGFASQIAYRLKMPNIEVKTSFHSFILDYLFTTSNTARLQNQKNLYLLLAHGRLEDFQHTLNTLFASIPYNNYTKNSMQMYEGFYATVIYTYLQSLGIEIIGEDVTNRGRIDLTLFVEDSIYIVEFKVDSNSTGALSQIKEKGYAQKYSNTKKKIYLVGVVFDSKERNIAHVEWERYL